MIRHRSTRMLLATTIGLAAITTLGGHVDAGAPLACTVSLDPATVTVHGDATDATAFTQTASSQGDWTGRATLWMAVDGNWQVVVTGGDLTDPTGSGSDAVTSGMVIAWLTALLGAPPADGETYTLEAAISSDPSSTYDANNMDCSDSVTITYRASSAPPPAPLPGTGSSTDGIALIALALLAVGGTLTFAAQRRRAALG